ncbi:MAG: hypothetical protein M3436_01495 [Pseudomonadota bacterium]|nr:hypothetical protein [Pseudomonadota bacterium]
MDVIKRYLRARLKEPSSWRGLVLLLTSLGVGISPEQADAIVAAGLAVAGAIGALAPSNPESK